MFTLDYSAEPNIRRSENDLLAVAFDTDSTTLVEGAIVKLLNTGKIAPVAAVTDVPLGIVEVVNNKYDTLLNCTVRTFAQAEVACIAGATVAIGALVAMTGWDATNKKNTVITAAAATYAIGIAISGGAVNETIKVLVYRTPFRTNP